MPERTIRAQLHVAAAGLVAAAALASPVPAVVALAAAAALTVVGTRPTPSEEAPA